MRNLTIAVCGNNSLHRVWNEKNPDFDLFVVYYGEGKNYEADGKYFDREKGTKFNIMGKIAARHKEMLSRYDAIFVPDDDLHMDTSSINRFFSIFHKYNLQLAQPSLIGWGSLPITFNVPMSLLRYTNWVEIMCPCFSQDLFWKASDTFMENRTNWGIEYLWSKILGYPVDKIAIVDDVVAIHTRPCFEGDTYYNNNNDCNISCIELEELIRKHNISREHFVYSMIKKSETEWRNRGSNDKFFPNVAALRKLIPFIREQPKLL